MQHVREKRKIDVMRKKERKKERKKYRVWFALVYLFNGISNPYGLFDMEIDSFVNLDN